MKQEKAGTCDSAPRTQRERQSHGGNLCSNPSHERNRGRGRVMSIAAEREADNGCILPQSLRVRLLVARSEVVRVPVRFSSGSGQK